MTSRYEPVQSESAHDLDPPLETKQPDLHNDASTHDHPLYQFTLPPFLSSKRLAGYLDDASSSTSSLDSFRNHEKRDQEDYSNLEAQRPARSSIVRLTCIVHQRETDARG